MKQCTKCCHLQPITEFHKGNNPDGFRTWCKTCVASYKKQYNEANRETILSRQRAYDAIKNVERREYFAQRYLASKSQINESNRLYRQQNPHKHAAKEARRRLAKAHRTPSWVTVEDTWMIKQAYELAALRTAMFGFEWHVDHILPLQGKTVSGFHVPNNLQVIPARMNYVKANRFEVAP